MSEDRDGKRYLLVIDNAYNRICDLERHNQRQDKPAQGVLYHQRLDSQRYRAVKSHFQKTNVPSPPLPDEV